MGSLKLRAERSLGPYKVQSPLSKTGLKLEALALTSISPRACFTPHIHGALLLPPSWCSGSLLGERILTLGHGPTGVSLPPTSPLGEASLPSMTQ